MGVFPANSGFTINSAPFGKEGFLMWKYEKPVMEVVELENDAVLSTCASGTVDSVSCNVGLNSCICDGSNCYTPR